MNMLILSTKLGSDQMPLLPQETQIDPEIQQPAKITPQTKTQIPTPELNPQFPSHVEHLPH